MTKDEFIAQYCAASKVTWEWLSKRRVALPCRCGEEGCEGWAMVSIELQDEHNRLYGEVSTT